MWTLTENPHAVVASAPGKRIVWRQQEVLLIDFPAQCSRLLRDWAPQPLDQGVCMALWGWWQWERRTHGH
jgi:hypothetical protein